MQKTVQVVIDIPEREYKVICENNYVAVCACPNLLSNAIKNGTVLPEHGRLVDADALVKKYDVGFINGRVNGEYINAPTILDATGEQE